MNTPGSGEDEPSNAFMTAPQSTYIITVTTERLENLAKGKGLAADEATAILKWHNEEVAQAVQQAVQKALDTINSKFDLIPIKPEDDYVDRYEGYNEAVNQLKEEIGRLAAAQPRKDGDA